MSYQQFNPHATLSPYIDAYWKVTGEGMKPLVTRILPDCCIDIIVNLGANFVADGSGYILNNEKAYLVGTMTHYKETIREPGSHLIAVRFKPAAFNHFYNYFSLHELTDKITEFEKQALPSTESLSKDFVSAFDNFFLGRLSPPKYSILPILNEIIIRKGKISVAELAKDQYTTIRQLQRLFREHIGISPKEYINFIRYKFGVQMIRQCYPTRSLMDIAFDCGYYDHAHLANDIKKYSGIVPSEF